MYVCMYVCMWEVILIILVLCYEPFCGAIMMATSSSSASSAAPMLPMRMSASLRRSSMSDGLLGQGYSTTQSPTLEWNHRSHLNFCSGESLWPQSIFSNTTRMEARARGMPTNIPYKRRGGSVQIKSKVVVVVYNIIEQASRS